MGKFNITDRRHSGTSVLQSSGVTGATAQGAPGYGRDLKSELFLLAVSNLVGENTFYETGDKRDSRYADLVRAVAVTDPEWLLGFVGWLRGEANMRSAALVAAAEGAKAMISAGIPGARKLVPAAMQRADEPGEFLAYWMSQWGRKIPSAVKRGVSEAVYRLYSEYSTLRYDTGSKGLRFGDVIELVHPTAMLPKSEFDVRGTFRGALYQRLLERRRNREGSRVPDAALPMLAAHAQLHADAQADPTVLLDTDRLKAAGFSWEQALSLAGDRVDKASLWEALLPTMGYMAQLRNLRNADEAGVSDAVASQVAARLADPVQVARSRQFPMRFLSAYRAAPSLRWAYPLEQALAHSLSNIPSLPGRTLILVDTSGSMMDGFSKDGTLRRWDAAVLFGVALAQRCKIANVWSFSNHAREFEVRRGESLLKSLERWKADGYFYGGGTYTAAALRATFAGHDRVVVLTDEQAGAYGWGYNVSDANDVNTAVPANVPLHTFNLAGYRMGHAPAGERNRFVYGGLSDVCFRMLPWIERGHAGDWPWLAKDTGS